MYTRQYLDDFVRFLLVQILHDIIKPQNLAFLKSHLSFITSLYHAHITKRYVKSSQTALGKNLLQTSNTNNFVTTTCCCSHFRFYLFVFPRIRILAIKNRKCKFLFALVFRIARSIFAYLINKICKLENYQLQISRFHTIIKQWT